MFVIVVCDKIYLSCGGSGGIGKNGTRRFCKDEVEIVGVYDLDRNDSHGVYVMQFEENKRFIRRTLVGGMSKWIVSI